MIPDNFFFFTFYGIFRYKKEKLQSPVIDLISSMIFFYEFVHNESHP